MEGNALAYPNTGYSNHNQYLRTEVFSADPVRLVCMLYRGALEGTAMARRHLKAGERRERSRQIMRVFAILRELVESLNPKYEDISRPLRELYVYMQGRLLDANARQVEEPLEEVERLLTTLHEGWQNAVPAQTAEAPVAEYQPLSCTY